jgi:hypothetical protein
VSDLKNTYLLTVGGETSEVVTRAEAVAQAKELSAETRVQLERADGVETMQFFGGSLETYIFETRDRRRKPRSSSEKDEE